MKILYHHRTHARGAEGVHIRSVITALEELGHSVDILSVPGVEHSESNIGAPVDKAKEKVKGINKLWSFMSKKMPGILFEFAEIFYNVPAYFRLKKALKNGNYDLIYERYAFFLIAGGLIAKKYNIPFVLEANEVNGIKGRARKQYLKALCILFEKKLFLLSNRIITVSSYLENLISERIQGYSYQGDVVVAPNAIDLNKIPEKQKSKELQKKYSLDQQQIVLGFAGWFDDWDRLDIFVRTIERLRSNNYNVAGLLIGDGKGVAEAKQLSKEMGIDQHVQFTGAVTRNEIYSHLNLLDIAVFPHSNEFGSPVVMFEFMALKIPVVAPKLLPILDVLSDKETALLFDILNENDLYDCVEEMLKEKSVADSLAENAYVLLKEKHTWLNNASLIVDPYEQ